MTAVLGSAASLTAEELAEAAGMPLAKAARLFPVCVALVERYAPSAPPSIRCEACIRVASWLQQQPSRLRKFSTGGVEFEFQDPAIRGALVSAGAASLLSPWKIRRAGAIS